MPTVTKDEACQRIALFLQPGCVINSSWSRNELFKLPWYLVSDPKRIGREAACVGIQKWQHDYFGDLGNTNDVHSRIALTPYDGRSKNFNPFNRDIFEVTLPEAQFVSLADISLDHLIILRFRYHAFTPEDIAFMRRKADDMKGTKYDIGQLFDYILFALRGYPRESTPVFDGGTNRNVCSSGVAGLLGGWRDWFDPERAKGIPRLFDIVDPAVWKVAGKWDNVDHALTEGGRIKTPIELTSPAHFHCSQYYQNEFEKIAEFNGGKRID